MCARDMFKNMGILCGCTDNEAELRFVYVNPIVRMLCTAELRFVYVNPIVRIRCDSMASADKITEKSTADYICYTLHHTTYMKLAAVMQL